MKPKALIISVRINWETETADDTMMTFVDATDDPMGEAYFMITNVFSRDFPDHEHRVWGNQEAHDARRKILKESFFDHEF